MVIFVRSLRKKKKRSLVATKKPKKSLSTKTRTFPLKIKAKAGWTTVGKTRCYFRSQLERNFAFYLQDCQENGKIFAWKYEPKLFYFNDIKRGIRCYKPDFFIMRTLQDVFWVECKGYMDAKSKTKLKRFAKYYPTEKILVIMGVKDFVNVLSFEPS